MNAAEIVSTLAIVSVVLSMIAIVRFFGSGSPRGDGTHRANSNDVYAMMLSAKYDLDAMAFEARRRIDETRRSRRGATHS